MKQFVLSACLSFGLVLSACNTAENPTTDTSEIPSDAMPVRLTAIGDGVWLHTTDYTFPGGSVVPSNGLAITDGDGLILVDTAWGELATKNLIGQLKTESGLDVKKAVITSYRFDRLAGVDYLEKQGVEVFTHPLTPAKSAAIGTPIPDRTVAALKEPGTRTAVGPIEISYPGPGYTDGNLVAYVKDKNILFGGGLLRGPKQKNLGNTADANLSEWGPSLARVKKTYPQTRIVIPSHGAVSNEKLIDHTLAIIADTVNKKRAADAAETDGGK